MTDGERSLACSLLASVCSASLVVGIYEKDFMLAAVSALFCVGIALIGLFVIDDAPMNTKQDGKRSK